MAFANYLVVCRVINGPARAKAEFSQERVKIPVRTERQKTNSTSVRTVDENVGYLRNTHTQLKFMVDLQGTANISDN